MFFCETGRRAVRLVVDYEIVAVEVYAYARRVVELAIDDATILV